MAKVEFEIAKKLLRPLKTEPGITLRDFTYNEEKCSFLMLADGYDMFKEQIRNNAELRYAVRGKSLEVFSKNGLKPLVDFGSGIAFNTEESLDIFEYLSAALSAAEYGIDSISMSSGSFSLCCSAETSDKDAFFTKISASLDKFGMGIIK